MALGGQNQFASPEKAREGRRRGNLSVIAFWRYVEWIEEDVIARLLGSVPVSAVSGRSDNKVVLCASGILEW